MHFALQGETGQEGPSGPRVSRGLHVHSVRFVTDIENDANRSHGLFIVWLISEVMLYID